MTVNILGTSYKIVVKKYDEDKLFSECAGYCDSFNKKIVLCDMRTYKSWENEEETIIQISNKENLRHEIVHAFFKESGLWDNSFHYDGAWAKSEEMVDWIALQGPKIYKAWQEADAL